VVSGDTGTTIASKNGISLATLESLNPTVNWSDLQIGQQLCIAAGSAPAPAPAPTPAPTTKAPTPAPTTKAPTPAPTPAPTSGCQKFYTVVSGDTGYGIATKNGITLAQLETSNPSANWNDLQIGQQLCVQGVEASEVAGTPSNFEQNKNWLIPVIIVIGLLLIATVVILARTHSKRNRSYSSELALPTQASTEDAVLKGETAPLDIQSPVSPTTPTSTADWEKRQDDAGHTYYYNLSTGVTQWEVPDGLPA